MRCVQEGETQDSTGNTGNMHWLGKGQDTRDYYTMNNRKKGWDLATTEFGCGTRFRDSRRLCGRDNYGCRDSELAVLVSNVTWVLRDVTAWGCVGRLREQRGSGEGVERKLTCGE